MRVIVADDEALLRQGLTALLATTDIDVVATVGDGRSLTRAVDTLHPDAVLVDIKMPPTHTDEGIRAALDIRRRHPDTGVLVLSHYLDSRYAMRLIETREGSVGYLLKERVSDLAVLVEALHRIADGESVVDPTIVARLINRRPRSPIQRLSEREREILALMAEGQSNARIGARLFLSPRTVEAHIGHIFGKLDLAPSDDYHRRVLAVLAYLRGVTPPVQDETRA
ncbi:response regulator transcription factor [Nostocoides sp. HKS02]|uniref:response regulator transcription factor n=1 Tax=Nostocoides sp. HKS02 TaxID=1813880 RepID=UPI0012B4FED6|nr:response regulator transcription factor [Tetrasphaera sp. HKS02]QGN58064.1 response regulator [Tetrasphaera sp. HKS02]